METLNNIFSLLCSLRESFINLHWILLIAANQNSNTWIKRKKGAKYQTNPNQQDGRSSPALGTFHLSSQIPTQKHQTALTISKPTQINGLVQNSERKRKKNTFLLKSILFRPSNLSATSIRSTSIFSAASWSESPSPIDKYLFATSGYLINPCVCVTPSGNT